MTPPMTGKKREKKEINKKVTYADVVKNKNGRTAAIGEVQGRLKVEN